MLRFDSATAPAQRWLGPFSVMVFLTTLALLGAPTDAAEKQQAKQKGKGRFQPTAQGPVAPPAPKSALLKMEDWQNVPLAPVQPAQIDALITKELQATKVAPAPLTTDEQFIRRATLDLAGQVPLPADVDEF